MKQRIFIIRTVYKYFFFYSSEYFLRAAMGTFLSSLDIHIFALCLGYWFIFAFMYTLGLVTGHISPFSLPLRNHSATLVPHLWGNT